MSLESQRSNNSNNQLCSVVPIEQYRVLHAQLEELKRENNTLVKKTAFYEAWHNYFLYICCLHSATRANPFLPGTLSTAFSLDSHQLSRHMPNTIEETAPTSHTGTDVIGWMQSRKAVFWILILLMLKVKILTLKSLLKKRLTMAAQCHLPDLTAVARAANLKVSMSAYAMFNEKMAPWLTACCQNNLPACLLYLHCLCPAMSALYCLEWRWCKLSLILLQWNGHLFQGARILWLWLESWSNCYGCLSVMVASVEERDSQAGWQPEMFAWWQLAAGHIPEEAQDFGRRYTSSNRNCSGFSDGRKVGSGNMNPSDAMLCANNLESRQSSLKCQSQPWYTLTGLFIKICIDLS